MTEAVRMDGKVVVVTGAGGGIGREIAKRLAAHGARLVVNDAGVAVDGQGGGSAPAEQVVAAITGAGGEAVASFDSVAEMAGARRIIQTALDRFGRVDGVVNNAGILRDRMFHKMTEPEWRAVIDVHLNGTFFVSRAAASHFRAQGSGAYLHMTSNAALIGTLGQANYGAAKLAICSLSRSIAIEMRRHGVRSNCISPSAWTRMVGSVPTDGSPEKAALVERARQMTPDKIAPLAVYLLSDAAGAITGQVFGVRKNEIMLFSQPRVVRSVHDGDGWSPEKVADIAMPALTPAFTPLDNAASYFSWPPI